LAVSASTHAVIDRRWVVQWFLTAKGADDWTEGPYLVDQSLHLGMLLIAAVVASTVDTAPALVTTLLVCGALLVLGLLVERHRAHSAVAPQPVSTIKH
jgi:hypothetical protein